MSVDSQARRDVSVDQICNHRREMCILRQMIAMPGCHVHTSPLIERFAKWHKNWVWGVVVVTSRSSKREYPAASAWRTRDFYRQHVTQTELHAAACDNTWTAQKSSSACTVPSAVAARANAHICWCFQWEWQPRSAIFTSCGIGSNPSDCQPNAASALSTTLFEARYGSRPFFSCTYRDGLAAARTTATAIGAHLIAAEMATCTWHSHQEAIRSDWIVWDSLCFTLFHWDVAGTCAVCVERRLGINRYVHVRSKFRSYATLIPGANNVCLKLCTQLVNSFISRAWAALWRHRCVIWGRGQ